MWHFGESSIYINFVIHFLHLIEHSRFFIKISPGNSPESLHGFFSGFTNSSWNCLQIFLRNLRNLFRKWVQGFILKLFQTMLPERFQQFFQKSSWNLFWNYLKDLTRYSCRDFVSSSSKNSSRIFPKIPQVSSKNLPNFVQRFLPGVPLKI